MQRLTGKFSYQVAPGLGNPEKLYIYPSLWFCLYSWGSWPLCYSDLLFLTLILTLSAADWLIPFQVYAHLSQLWGSPRLLAAGSIFSFLRENC